MKVLAPIAAMARGAQIVVGVLLLAVGFVAMAISGLICSGGAVIIALGFIALGAD